MPDALDWLKRKVLGGKQHQLLPNGISDDDSTTAQQLVERFHSESTLCSDRRRGLAMYYAAEQTRHEIQLTDSVLSLRENVLGSCRHLGELDTNLTRLRQSQEDVRQTFRTAEATLAAQRVMMDDLGQKTQETQDKLTCLETMTSCVTEATAMLSENIQAAANKAARLRWSEKAGGAEAGDAGAKLKECWEHVDAVDKDLQQFQQGEMQDVLNDLERMTAECDMWIEHLHARQVA
jgi:chromosome segregation ATPase